MAEPSPAELRELADKKADAASGSTLAPHQSLRFALESLRLEIRAAALAAERDRLHAGL